jgi:hypothetical protein
MEGALLGAARETAVLGAWHGSVHCRATIIGHQVGSQWQLASPIFCASWIVNVAQRLKGLVFLYQVRC